MISEFGKDQSACITGPWTPKRCIHVSPVLIQQEQP